MYEVLFSKQAEKDKKLLKQVGLEKKARQLLDKLCKDPFQNPHPFEKILGDLNGKYSRRINITHRIVYKAVKKRVIILRMWTHYGDKYALDFYNFLFAYSCLWC